MFYKDLLLKKPSEIYLLVKTYIVLFIYHLVACELRPVQGLEEGLPVIAINFTIPKEKN